MAEMSMNRVIHGAFRRDLQRFEDALAAFSDGDAGRTEQLWTAWANFDDQLTRHHVGEHEIAWPTLRQLGLSEDLLTQWDAEHDRMAEALRAADEAMRTLRGSPSAANAQAARDATAKLSAIALEHLDHEETELEPFYLAKKDTPEIKAMVRKFAKMRPPGRSSPGCRTARRARSLRTCGAPSRDRCLRFWAGCSAGPTAARSRRSGARSAEP